MNVLILHIDFNSDGRLFHVLGHSYNRHFCQALHVRNVSSNLNLDIRIVWPWLAGWNISSLSAGEKLHDIDTDTLIYPVLYGEPVYNLEFFDLTICCVLNSGKKYICSRMEFLDSLLVNPGYHAWSACITKMKLNKGF